MDRITQARHSIVLAQRTLKQCASVQQMQEKHMLQAILRGDRAAQETLAGRMEDLNIERVSLSRAIDVLKQFIKDVKGR